MRNRYDKYKLKFSKDEKTYNKTEEKITNFTEQFSSKTESGEQYLGFTFDKSENGVSSKGYILSVTKPDGQYNYSTYDNKKEFDNAINKVKELVKK